MAVWKGVLYVFGGTHGRGKDVVFYYDLHTYFISGRAWADFSLPSSGIAPKGRKRHTMEAWEGTLYVFGGIAHGGEWRNDLHAYDVASGAWTDLSLPLSGSAPPGKYSHPMAVWEGVLYVHGCIRTTTDYGVRT